MNRVMRMALRASAGRSRAVGRALAVLLILSFVAPSDAFAQRTGSRMGRNAVNGRRDAYTLIAIIGTCLAERRPALVRRWFGLLPGSREEAALLDSQGDDLGVCMSDDQLILGDGRILTYTPRRLRVSTALAMARRGLSDAPAQSPLSRDSDPWFVAPLASLASGSTIDRASILGQEFGHCLVVTDWASARALLAARDGSRDERSAFHALIPVLGGCLPQGMQIGADAKGVREFIAEPFYHAIASARPADGN
jgi:hypothetical protein